MAEAPIGLVLSESPGNAGCDGREVSLQEHVEALDRAIELALTQERGQEQPHRGRSEQMGGEAFGAVEGDLTGGGFEPERGPRNDVAHDRRPEETERDPGADVKLGLGARGPKHLGQARSHQQHPIVRGLQLRARRERRDQEIGRQRQREPPPARRAPPDRRRAAARRGDRHERGSALPGGSGDRGAGFGGGPSCRETTRRPGAAAIPRATCPPREAGGSLRGRRRASMSSRARRCSTPLSQLAAAARKSFFQVARDLSTPSAARCQAGGSGTAMARPVEPREKGEGWFADLVLRLRHRHQQLLNLSAGLLLLGRELVLVHGVGFPARLEDGVIAHRRTMSEQRRRCPRLSESRRPRGSLHAPFGVHRSSPNYRNSSSIAPRRWYSRRASSPLRQREAREIRRGSASAGRRSPARGRHRHHLRARLLVAPRRAEHSCARRAAHGHLGVGPIHRSPSRAGEPVARSAPRGVLRALALP